METNNENINQTPSNVEDLELNTVETKIDENAFTTRRRIRRWVTIFFTFNVSFIIINYILTVIFSNLTSDASQYVSVANENEAFIRRLNLIITSIYQGNEELKDVLKHNIERYDNNFQALKSGGTVQIGDEIVKIDASTDAAQDKLVQIGRNWSDLKTQLLFIIDEPIQIDSTITAVQEVTIPGDSLENDTTILSKSFTAIPITNPKVERAYIYAKGNLDDILNKSRELSSLYLDNFERSQTNQQLTLLITMLANAGLLVFGAINILLRFINPLGKIAQTAQEVAQGDANTKVAYRRKDEIGAVADSLNLVVNNFQQYSEFANNIGQGQFNVNLEVKSEKDVLGGALLKMRDSLNQVSEEDKKRNWSNEGFTLFNGILRNSDRSINDLSYEIISNLVKYINANQGGLFLLEKNGKGNYLDLKSNFAYDKRRYEQKQIAIGEGILGQSVLEKEIAYITNTPEDYIKITSGLGDAPPNVILIVPLLINQDIFGAIEIASFKHFEDYELDFIKQISENIASTMATVRNNENMKVLLEDSQETAEKMLAQEEEMRQNMEELSATQEKMRLNQEQLETYKKELEDEVERRTAELQDKENQLSNTLLQLEGVMESSSEGIVALNTEYTVVAVNTKIQQIIRQYYSESLAIGMSWLDIYQEEDEKNRFKRFWDRALSGEEFSVEYVIISSDTQNRNWFEISFNPILLETGDVVGASLFMRNITRRKRSQFQIERTAKILDNSTNEVYLFDANTFKFVEVNGRGLDKLGYSLNELKDIPFYVLELEFDQTGFEKFVAPLKNGEVENLLFQTIYQRKDGSTYDVEVNMQYFSDEDPPLFAAIVQDISDRKQNELKLEDAITRFDLVSRATNEGLWEMYISEAGRVAPQNNFWFSEQFALLLGYDDKDETFGNTLDAWSSLLHPEDRENILEALDKHLADTTNQTPFNTEYRLLSKEGEYIWFFSTGTTLRDEQGNPIKIAGTIRNIARRKRAEQQAREQVVQNQAILDAAVNAIVAIDMRGRIFSANKATSRIFGYTHQELIGQNVKILIPEEHAKKHNQYIRKYHETGEKKIIGTNREETAKKKDGTLFPVEISISEGNIGNRRFYIGIIRDISIIKEQERQVLEGRERLRQIVDASSEGIYITRDFIIEDANEAFSEITGYEISELIGQNVLNFFIPESRDLIRQRISQKKQKAFEAKIKQKNGIETRVILNLRKVTSYDNHEYSITSVQDLTKANEAEKSLIESQTDLQNQIIAIKQLGKFLTVDWDKVTYIENILKLLSDTLKVDRVSFWQYENKTLSCLRLFERDSQGFIDGQIWKYEDYPNYFDKLQNQEMIILNDTRNHDFSPTFTESYLQLMDVQSLLSIPLLIDQQLKYVLTFENVAEMRVWKLEEHTFYNTLPYLLSLGLRDK